MKRIVTIQDISCIGKCSLTVALPIISAMGIEAAIIPTAVLSTHTAFTGFTFHDLTAEIPRIADHWQAQGVAFDGIYTGYLGSFEQLDLMASFFERFGGSGKTIFVDPCMADNGKLYAGFTVEFAHAMARLCGRADIIAPNITEACLLVDEPYPVGGYDAAFIDRLLHKLADLGARRVILKGVSYEAGSCAVLTYDGGTGRTTEYVHELLPQTFHGTGDIFASAAFGAVTRGAALPDAVRLAADFTVEAIRRTMAHAEHNWYGVDFEAALPLLIKNMAASCPEA